MTKKHRCCRAESGVRVELGRPTVYDHTQRHCRASSKYTRVYDTCNKTYGAWTHQIRDENRYCSRVYCQERASQTYYQSDPGLSSVQGYDRYWTKRCPWARSPVPQSQTDPGAMDVSKTHTEIEVIDQTRGAPISLYGEHYVVSVDSSTAVDDIIKLLAPNQKRHKILVRWGDGVTEELDRLVPVNDICIFAKQLCIKRRKRVRWL